MSGVVGVIQEIAETVVTFAQDFAEDVVAAGAQILNSFLNALAGPAAKDKVISEFSTQNSYLYSSDSDGDTYIDALHNTDRIYLNSLIKGTSIADEIITFYRKTYASSDFNLGKALDIVRGGEYSNGDMTYCPMDPGIESNFTLPSTLPFIGTFNFREILPSATLRVNNTNLFEGSIPAEYDSTGGDFIWRSILDPDFGYSTVGLENNADLVKVQTSTKDYLKALGMPDPETLLDDLPYTQGIGGGSSGTYSDVIDSAFINFRVKWVSGKGRTGNRISNKYLWLLAERLYYLNDMPHELTYDETLDEVYMFQYEVIGDGQNYTMGLSHVSRSPSSFYSVNPTSHTDYQYDKNLTSSDGYYYYDANKTLPNGDHSAQTVADVQDYLDSFEGTVPTEAQANWLEIEENGVAVTIGGVESVFPDEIYLVGSNIILKIYDSTEEEYINATDQVLRVGNLYMYKSATEILFATVPESVYSNASATYGKSNTTGVTYYTVYNVSAIERVTDYAGEDPDTDSTFRYIAHKLDASNNCVSAPILTDILEYLDPFERHKLVLASANLSLHLAYYLRIEKTWEQKLRAAVLNVIKIGAIIFAIWSMGSATSLAIAAEMAIVAYATSIAINVFIEHILVPVIISNFGEDEALILLAVAAVAIAYYTRKSSTTGLNQFPNQVALFTTSIDIMNQMYTLAVVQPGIIEMRKEQDEWTATDSELTEEEEALQDEMDALFGTEDSPNHLLNLQIRAALNPMPASAYISYHDTLLERQFDCFDYEKYNELNVS